MMTMMALVVPHVLAASCQPSSSYGCLNGYAYNYTTQVRVGSVPAPCHTRALSLTPQCHGV